MLIDAGLNRIDMGIQSGSWRVRKEIFKRFDSNEDILKAAQLFSKHKKLYVIYDIIVDNPFETKEDKNNALFFLLKLPGSFKLYLRSLYFMPGSKLTEESLQKGIISKTDIAWQKSGKVVRELTDNWHDYRGGKRELSWVMLLKCFNVDYYGFRLYPRWLLRMVGSITSLRRCPNILQFLLNFLCLFNKTYIYIKKNGLINFFKYSLKKIKNLNSKI